MEAKVYKIISQIIEDNTGNVILDIIPESNLKDDLGLDSLSLAMLTVQLEEEFNIDVFEDGIVFTVSDILKKLNG